MSTFIYVVLGVPYNVQTLKAVYIWYNLGNEDFGH